MEYYYVYLGENLITGTKYIGEHFTNNINDNYLGSGKRIKKAIKKYGKNNFKKTILEFFPNKEDAYKAQEFYIKKYNTLHPNGYNICKFGGSNIITELTRDKLSKAGKKRVLTEEHKNKIRNTNKSQIPWNKGKKGLQSHSEEVKANMRLKHLGKKMSEESKEKNRIAHLKENLSQSTILKMKNSAINRHKK